MKNDMTVFIIDDDIDDQEILVEGLKEIDHSINCITSSNATMAVKNLIDGSIKPDLIFLDLNLPKMNGYEVLHVIKHHEHIKAIPVFMYSTSAEREQKAKALEMGASSFITKPTSMGALRKILEGVLSIDYSAH